MDKDITNKYDVIVIGAGHAGCEAALASARLGKKTVLFAMTLESIAMMPCNPSIGGTGKGHLVREIDALGGEMGLNIDKAFIQSKMLNTAKGPAVHSLRAQADKNRYHVEMKKVLENTDNLDIKQAEIADVIVQNNEITGVVTSMGTVYESKSVIIATGTFLRAKIYVGDVISNSGPNGLAPSINLSDSLTSKGIDFRRFKTGTPARVLSQSLNYEKMKEERGDEHIVPFSFMNDEIYKEQVPCWLTYTNQNTHEIIKANFHRSALFGGQIEGVGPRYCPSIEDKINRFSDKERHQLFIEPEGLDTNEMYIQGMSSSLPEDVQEDFYRSIPGLENARITRYAYAIEYDSINPQDLFLHLEHRKISSLFFAGQINGSSGYEEAAAQGLIAGINASLKIDGKDPFVLGRDEAYIGVLIDDLVTKGTNEPYRIMTSRAEYRLLLRQDNADLRLTEKSYNIGLASSERYSKYLEKKEMVETEVERLETTYLFPKEANEFLKSKGTSPIQRKLALSELLRRPEIKYSDLQEIDEAYPKMPYHAMLQIEVQMKYSGYIAKQIEQVRKFKKLENKTIPSDIVYDKLSGIRIEAKQKLADVRPVSIGQASRIPGVSPADINVLLIHLEKLKWNKGD